jgi:hypothetical protein
MTGERRSFMGMNPPRSVGDTMPNETPRRSTPFFLVFLMLLAPFAGASVTTFADGSSEVDIEIRDGAPMTNIVDGAIDLPVGETVTAATMTISTEMIEHAAHSRIDLETSDRVWNPAHNNQLTEFSDETLFQYEDSSGDATPLSLKAEGFLTDFEGTFAGFLDLSNPPPGAQGWVHGAPSSTDVPANCASGNDCWGTNLGDNNYTDDNGELPFELYLNSPEMYVNPTLKSKTATFSSWHNFEAYAGGAQNSVRYADCGYLQIRSSPNPGFPPDDSGFQFLPIDAQNSTGIGFGQGYAQRAQYSWQLDNKIDTTCGGLSGQGANQKYGLAGSSTYAQNPTGWATIAVDLNDFIGDYVQIRFVMEHNGVQEAETPLDDNMSGWHIDNFRLGDVLPQNASMTVRGISPSVFGGENHPNGYGLLSIEASTSLTAQLSVDVLDANNRIIDDTSGVPMVGLTGDIIELWDIDTSRYYSVNLRFNFDSGPDRLSTAVMHGFSMGTRVGTGFNASSTAIGSVANGIWSTPGGGMPMIYTPSLIQEGFSTSVERSKFSYPITSVTPYIQDDCSESPEISIVPVGQSDSVNLTADVKTSFGAPILGFTSVVSYMGSCEVSGIWFDLEFGHHAKHLRIDVANDGDVDYGFTEPAFGMFGRQTNFILNKVDNINYAADDASMTLNVNGDAEGAFFMLPAGAEISSADVSFDDNTIRSNSNPEEGFALSLMAGSQSVGLGDMPNRSIIITEALPTPLEFKDALNSLLTNPSVAGNHQDEFGRYWVTFRFAVSSPNASSGTSLNVVGLDIVYNYSTTINTLDGFDIELNQGIALWTGGGANARVPIAVHSDTGGGVEFSGLSVSSSTGYSNTLSVTDNPAGLYPNGEIYEVITTHAVDPLTGTALSEAWVTFESPTDYIKISWSDFMQFSEASDEHDLITLESTSSVSEYTNGKQVKWHFRVNSNWDDTEAVRMYAGLTTASNVNGLPDALLFDPSVGNAVENDAGITSFELQNSIGVAQSLTNAESGQDINLVGEIRLQDLPYSPDPAAYFLVLELKHVNNTDGNITIEWEEVANRSGTIGGDFNWNVDLGSAAGSETYRFAIRGYEGGDILCPPTVYNPDETCAIPFDITIDTYEPNLLDIEVLSPGTDNDWRLLLDDTWVVPQESQEIRMNSQDLPNPPATLDLHYWVQHDHDANSDGIPDASEYATITLQGDGEAPTANYTGVFNDYANVGQDPEGKVSLWIEGYDLAGNPIDGGAPGFENDKVTYVSMSSESPVIRNFFIEDSMGSSFLNSASMQWEGKWNQTMYAGNTYHLLAEANDDNGWRDIDYFKVVLDKTRDDMIVWYFPRNDTAWTDSPYIEIVQEDDDSVGPSLRAMDGTALIDPFESDFILDIPIRIDWGVVGLTAESTPELFMQDLDNALYRMLPSPGRYIQKWYYSDGIRLDVRDDSANDLMITPYFEDMSAPYTQDVRRGFIYSGDTIHFSGQYAYRDGIFNSVFVNPEAELTMEITRLETLDTQESRDKGYVFQSSETTYHNFSGGVFAINITAPVFTNEYTYEFKLVNLPTGAEDFTAGFCEDNPLYGCSTFNIKVDRTAPTVLANSWLAQKGETSTIISDVLSTATFHCVDLTVTVAEQEAMFYGDLMVNWKFYDDPLNDKPWGEYVKAFGTAEPKSVALELKTTPGGYVGSSTCLDLWPLSDGQFDPPQSQMGGVEIVMWVSGVDSAGSGVRLGGGPQDDGSISPIVSSIAQHKSMYSFIHEEATFEILNVRLDDNPRVGDKMNLEVEVRNTGTMAGSTQLTVKSVMNGLTPASEGIIEVTELGIGEKAWFKIELEPFGEQTTGMYYVVSVNGTGDVLYDGNDANDAFNVKIAEDDDSSNFLLIVGLLVVVIGVLGTLVVVLARRGGGESMLDDEYEDEDEYLEGGSSKVLAEIPADVDPTMAQAMKEFPQWTQSEIQGYFDQGWDIAALHDWVNNQ